MKIFKTPNSQLFAFEADGSQDHLIRADMTEITEAEADAIRAAQTVSPDATVVTMRQARLALLAVDLLDEVEVAINSISDAQQRKAAQIEWEFASTVEKNSPLIQMLAPSIGLDQVALTSLFNTARSL